MLDTGEVTKPPEIEAILDVDFLPLDVRWMFRWIRYPARKASMMSRTFPTK